MRVCSFFSAPVLIVGLLLLSLTPPVSAQTPAFANGVAVGVLSSFDITEASGLLASRQNPGVLWTHNDNGFPGTIFAVSTNGDFLGRYTVPNVFFGDFEDIAFGPGPTPEFQYIYLGDIGDNFETRSSIRLLRFPEPAAYPYQSVAPRYDFIPEAQEITLSYPDKAYNAEAMLVDPITGDLYLATKLTNSSRIYRANRADLDSGEPVLLNFVREISFFKVSGGDISVDGRLILLRRGGKGAAWVRSASQSVGDALGGSSINIPIAVEPNGEAIAIHPTGLGYYTLSEGYGQTNYYYRRTDSGVPKQPVTFIKPGEVWRFHDLGEDPGAGWQQLTNSDATWAFGAGQLGYGQGDEQTVVSYGLDDFAKNITTYFRKTFTKASTVTVTNLALRTCFSDGVVVYLNGQEVFRRNLPTSPRYEQLATVPDSSYQNFWVSTPVDPALLRTGTNLVAVEVHRFDPAGAELSFDLQLVEGVVEKRARFTSLPTFSAGQCQLSLSGPAGSTVRIEATADFQYWERAGHVVLTNGVGIFREPKMELPRLYRLHY